MAGIERLLSALHVAVEPFAICEVRGGWRMDLDQLGFVTVHYVLAGRGTIEIASNRAEDAAKIHINALTTQKDLDEAVQGSKVIRALMRAPALKSMTVEEISPGPQVDSDAAMLQYFREQSGSIYHLCGSCAMGPDAATSVVDASLRVHGLQALRIVDASVFPNITSGNINAPTMMVAEKGADLILADALRTATAGAPAHTRETVPH